MSTDLNAENDPIDDYHNTSVNTAVKLCEVQLLELFCKVVESKIISEALRNEGFSFHAD